MISLRRIKSNSNRSMVRGKRSLKYLIRDSFKLEARGSMFDDIEVLSL